MTDKKYTKVIVKYLGKFFHRTEVINYISNIPQYNDKPIMIICNHSSFTEPTAVIQTIYKTFNRIPIFMAMNEMFNWPIVGKIVRDLNFIPVKRNTKNARAAIDPAVKALEDNEILALYPEGSLSIGRNGDEVQKFKSGAARIALSNKNIIVIPMAQAGSKSGKLNIIKALMFHTKLKIVIGEPISISDEFYRNSNDSETIIKLSELFRDKVEDLRVSLAKEII